MEASNIISDSKKTSTRRVFHYDNQINSTENPKFFGSIVIINQPINHTLREQSSTHIYSHDSNGRVIALVHVRDEKAYENKLKLESFKDLSLNWNHYNGLPIPVRLIELASNLIDQLDYQPSIFPTGRGTIQFDFSKGEDEELEIEISLKSCSILEIRGDNETESSIRLEQIPGVISNFYAG